MDKLYEISFAIFSLLFGVALAMGSIVVLYEGYQLIAHYL